MKRDILALFTIASLIIIFFFRLFWPEPNLIVTPDFGRSDAWHFTFATKYLLGKSLHNNTLPLWIPELGNGFPLLAEGQTGTFFLPNLFLYRFLDAITAYNASIVIAIITLGWGTYAWLRLIKFQIFPALFGSITVVFSGMTMAQMPHGALIQGVSLLPWVMVCTLRRKMIFLSFIFSQQLLTGFPQAAFITLFFAAGYALWLRANVLRFGFAIALALGLSAIQLIPSWEFLTQTSVAHGIDPDAATYFSYPLKHLVTLANPFALGNPKFGTYPPFFNFDGSIFWENVGGIGWVPILFALAALTKIQSQRIKFFLISLAASFLFMLGKYSPLYLVYSFWPFNFFRVPSRFIWIFVLSLLIVATHGMDMLWQQKHMQKSLRLILILFAAVNTITLFTSWYSYHAFEPADTWLRLPNILSVLSKKATILTVGAEAVHNQSFLNSGWQTMQTYRDLREALAPNSNAIWKITSANVYAGRFLRRPSLFDDLLAAGLTSNYSEATLSGLGKKFLDLSGVNTIIASVPLSQTGTTRLTSKSTQGAITVWDNPTALPRAYLATRIHLATTKEEAFNAMSRDDFIPGQSVLLEKPIPGSFRPKEITAGRVQLTQQTEASLAVVVEDNDSDAVLVITDTYYPGWEATLDEKPAPIIATNIKQRGIMVPAGNHIVRFFYTPKSLVLGGMISISALLLVFIVMVSPLVFSSVHTRPIMPLLFRYRPRNHAL